MAACGTPKVLCLFVLGLVRCEPQRQTRVIYGVLNGSVTFPVAASISFKEILWKKGKNKVMEWEMDFQPEPRLFPPFMGRTVFNKESGDLSVFNLTYSDEDEYELELESPDIKDDIKFRLEVFYPDLQVDMVVSNTMVPKNATFQLDCRIVSCSSWNSHFTVAWYFLKTKVPGRKGSPDLEAQEEEEALEEEEEEAAPREQTELLSVGLDGVFGQEGCPWKGRLRFQSLSPRRYRLTVLQARPQDTGSYSCRMEEWLRSPQGTWYRLMEQESAPIGVRVPDAGLVLYDPQRQTRVIYGAVNGSVTFPVAAPASFKEILWKKGHYPVILWEADTQPEPRTFWPFVGRTSLDTESGDLSIYSLTHSDEDEYELESPDIKDSIKFHLKVIDPLPPVTLNCTLTGDIITVQCRLEEPDLPRADLLQYSWLCSGAPCPQDTRSSEMYLEKNRPPEEVTCVVRNPLSERNSSMDTATCVPVNHWRSWWFLLPVVLLVCLPAAVGGYRYINRVRSVSAAPVAGTRDDALKCVKLISSPPASVLT